MTTLLPHIQIETAPQPGAAIIWLHGLGADGHDFAGLVPELDLSGCPAIRFIFPHAPSIPVTLNGGYVMPAWYDILGADLIDRQDAAGIRASEQAITALIEREMARGIPASRIVLAGFSQGCAMALHTGLRFPQTLAASWRCRATCRWPRNLLQSAAPPTPTPPSSWRTASRTRWWSRPAAKPVATC
jgi:phospholipase/carboxylesterase